MISGIPTINLGCFVLCLMTCIVMNIATEPPIAERSNRVLSFTRHAPVFALALSATVTIIAIIEIRAKYPPHRIKGDGISVRSSFDSVILCKKREISIGTVYHNKRGLSM